jgi:hypothetical protein
MKLEGYHAKSRKEGEGVCLDPLKWKLLKEAVGDLMLGD